MWKLAWNAVAGALGGVSGYLAVAGLALALGAAGTWRVMSWREAAAGAGAAQQAVRLVTHQTKLNFQFSMNFEGLKASDTQATNQLLDEVKTHVTPAIDDTHPVPCGFVRLFNAGAHDPVPDGACGPDDAPSGIALSDVARASTENAGLYDVCAAQLTALQDWVTAQHKLSQGQ